MIADGARDIVGNMNNNSTNIIVEEQPDTILPNISNVYIDFSVGVITVSCTETIDSTPSSRVDLSQLFIANVSGGKDLALVGGVVTAMDGANVTITLSEVQRVNILKMSAQRPDLVGDGSSVVLDVGFNALSDIAVNYLLTSFGTAVIEIPDIVPPTFFEASINYGTGILTMKASETIDLTPKDRTAINLIEILDSDRGDPIQLTASVLTEQDDIVMTLTLDEISRVSAIRISGTKGGDTTAALITAYTGAVHDLVGNQNIPSVNMTLLETPDNIPPVISAVTFDAEKGGVDCGYQRCGAVYLVFSEIIDITLSSLTNIVNSRLSLHDTVTTKSLPLTASNITQINFTTVVFTVPESYRASAIRISGNPGGDGAAMVMRAETAAFKDVATNVNFLQDFINVFEIPDLTPPKLNDCALDLGTGILKISFSEYMDATSNGAFALENIFIANHTDRRGDKDIRLSSGATVEPKDFDVLTIILSEINRVKAIRLSNVTGGDDNDPVLEMVGYKTFRDVSTNLLQNLTNQPIQIKPDKTPPEIKSVSINYMTGLLTITCSETIDLDPTSKFDLSKVELFTMLPNAPNPKEFSLTNRGFESTKYADRGSATIISQSGPQINISMLPHMRWQALGMYDEAINSGNLGLVDPVYFRISSGTMQDVSSNLNRKNATGVVLDPEDSYVYRFVSGMVSIVGEGGVAVVDYGKTNVVVGDVGKTFIFNGTGINDGDHAKFVSNSFTSSEDCQNGAFPPGLGGGVTGDGVDVGLNETQLKRLITVNAGRGNMIRFSIPTAQNKPYKLCYQFADEPYKLFELVTLHVKMIVSVTAAKFGSYNMAVVAVPKPFLFNGYGVEDATAGDRKNTGA